MRQKSFNHFCSSSLKVFKKCLFYSNETITKKQFGLVVEDSYEPRIQPYQIKWTPKIALVNLLILKKLLLDRKNKFSIANFDSLRFSTNSGIPLNSVAIKNNFFVFILIQLFSNHQKSYSHALQIKGQTKDGSDKGWVRQRMGRTKDGSDKGWVGQRMGQTKDGSDKGWVRQRMGQTKDR